MTRTLLAAIFLTLFSQTAWADVGVCRLHSQFKDHNCQEGDSLRYITTDPEFSWLEDAAWRYCNMDKEVIMTVRRPVQTATVGSLVCVYQYKVQRAE